MFYLSKTKEKVTRKLKIVKKMKINESMEQIKKGSQKLETNAWNHELDYNNHTIMFYYVRKHQKWITSL